MDKINSNGASEMVKENEEKKTEFEGSKVSDEELAKLYENTFTPIQEGEVVKGKISEVTSRDVMVDIGYKSEGSVPIDEFDDLENLKLGDPVKVFVIAREDEEGMVDISKERADKYLGWKHIEENYEEGDTIEGKVDRKVKGGLIVDIGIDAFLPGSLSSMKGPAYMDEMLGNNYKFKIIKITKSRKNVVVSRRAIVEAQLRKKSEKLLNELEKGQIRKGVVKNITDFGAFIDLGGVDGLLHITDMSWGRVNHPSEMLALKDEVEVMILDVNKEERKVSLGLKQKTKNPWEEAEEKYPVGTKVKGKVVNIVPYGAFVELEKGIEGLIHISEMSWVRKIKNPSEIVGIGDVVEAVVLDLDAENQRISLGMKQLEPNPWEGVEDRYTEGSVVKGKIHHITDYGAFVELEDGVDGLIHVSDISWTKKVKHPKEILEKGQTVEAKVLYVDAENQRISLGLKQMKEDPWPKLVEKYSSGTECEGKIVKIADFGMFVELEEGVEALLHNSEIDLPDEKIKQEFSEGDNIEAKVIRTDKNKHQIRLSIKQKESEEDSEEEEKETAQDTQETDSDSEENDNIEETSEEEVEEKVEEEKEEESTEKKEE